MKPVPKMKDEPIVVVAAAAAAATESSKEMTLIPTAKGDFSAEVQYSSTSY